MAKKPNKQTPKTPNRSFRDLNPIEQGGRTARAGFEFQDHIAAAKCLDMLLGGGPVEVWCEAEDDTVLVWFISGAEYFEFVQVKSANLGRAWTVAEICKQESAKGNAGTGNSIVGKSLAHDRADEECRFRIVTTWPPEEFLSILALDLANASRIASNAKVAAVSDALVKKLGPLASPNGRDVHFWTSVTVWEVQATSEGVKNASLLKLERVLDANGIFLAPDQRAELYDRLFRKVQDASLADGVSQKTAKRLIKDALLDWLKEQADIILHPSQAGSSARLEAKLVAAGADASTVNAAKEHRWRYLHEVRKPKYLAVRDREQFEDEAFALLHRLKTRLDAEELKDNGLQFLSRCQQVLLDLRDSIKGQAKPPEGIVYGYLYDVLNRCLHRLVRGTP